MAWLALGFRPFFVLAAAAAIAGVATWIAVLEGLIAPPGGAMAGVTWHAHEMIFGFAMAIVAGFLLTAAPNWTSTRGLSGMPLAALAGLWLAGRIGAFAPAWLPWWTWMTVDLLFPLSLAWVVGVPIFRTRNLRNAGLPVILVGVGALEVVLHMAIAGRLAIAPTLALRLGVHAVVLLMVVVGGRVTPAFTRNTLRGVAEVRPTHRLDTVAIAAVVAVLALLAIPGVPGFVAGGACALAAGLNAARMRGWASRAAARVPLLCILHVGYAWLVVGLALEALAFLRPALVPASAALHAFTAGAVGSYGLGMMSRVSLGHTGRPLVASRITTMAFVAVVASGCVRVGAGLFGAIPYVPAMCVAGVLWCSAFGAFLWVHAPMLARPRPDGRPG